MSIKASAAGAGTSGTIIRKGEKQKVGHRRVDDEGQVTYKKRPTNEIMKAIQLGINDVIGKESQKTKRDLLTQDFGTVEIVYFPREGGKLTLAHNLSSFTFRSYAPVAFRHFRDLYKIERDQFLASICGKDLTELSNPGASGSIFYRTADDNFIIKTVQHKEAKYLQRLMVQYYLTLTQNPRTLLPKFYGLYCYQCGQKNIRFVVMNNLLPSTFPITEKYDLKGSTYKRQASSSEREKSSPTYKDLDFRSLHSGGLFLESEIYSNLVRCIERDCLVLQSFSIMDYSMLLAVYNLDQAQREKQELEHRKQEQEHRAAVAVTNDTSVDPKGLQRGLSLKKISVFNTPMESINAENSTPVDVNNDEVDITAIGGIPARNSKGERIVLFMGIIDILQNYRLLKKMEHAMKSIITDGDSISVTNPTFYSQRFQTFLKNDVFKKVESSMKAAPNKRRNKQAKVNSVDVDRPLSHASHSDTEMQNPVLNTAVVHVSTEMHVTRENNKPQAVSVAGRPSRAESSSAGYLTTYL